MKTMPAFLATILLLHVPQSYAGLIRSYDDATVVERSDLIVVGRLILGTIVFVPHAKQPNMGHSGEHHATLSITEVLKGQCDTNVLPITIYQGLTPVVGGYVKQEHFMINRRGDRKDYPPNIVEIVDVGTAAMYQPLVEDAAENNIWFLRKHISLYGPEADGDRYGIGDPEDLQPLFYKEYFIAHISTNPTAVAQYIHAHPGIATSRIERIMNRHMGKE